ncbi:MAG: peptide chain release factor N(5)-glutamine methyltransferase [Nitrospiraceae bacterium]|nr:MAG: peptide chain release factor N(5)-glutamine methyltransferase [Nitrospiraceae bacterium]
MMEDFLHSYNTFRENGVENPLLETLRLFDLLSCGLLRATDLSLLRQEHVGLSQFVQMRKEGLPMEYIIGRATFMGNMFFCTPDTLIPTEESDLLVKTAADLIRKRQERENIFTVVEVGTGCGNIAVSLAMNSKDTRILASDISPAAIEIAKKNVSHYCLQDRISLFSGDLFAPFHSMTGKIDMVVCNPPYIPTGSLDKLPPEIIDHEPRIALDGGPYGIDLFRRLISGSLEVLRPKGILVFEIGERQEKLVARLFEKNKGYEDIEYFRHDEIIRVIGAVKTGNEVGR